MRIKPLGELNRHDVSIAGGKGASLGEMIQVGIPVPDGFVVLSSAFESFLQDTGLHSKIDAILQTIEMKEVHAVEQASEKIQQLILNAKMPADTAAEVQKSFDQLHSVYVAVRSSATAEDSASAAWAGQLDSYLNTTSATLLQNVQRCWASLFTPRAVFYRFEKGLQATKISVAVVVQKMVASEMSGIAFSVHPITENRNHLIIEATYGLGEAIVSGQITPDSYVVEKEPRRIIGTNITTQKKALYRAVGGGNEWRDIAEPQASAQTLTSQQALELAELIVRIEKHCGFPCDIEWAYEEGRFYIVQSRPITTLSSSDGKETLSAKFMRALGNDEIFKVEGDFLPLLVMVDWFNYYDENGDIKNVYPAICFKNGSTLNIYWNLSKYRAVSKQVFRMYIEGSFELSQLQEKYGALEHTINEFYKDYYLHPAKDEVRLLERLNTAHRLLRDIDLHTLFLDALDQRAVQEVLTEAGREIDLSNVWKVSHILDTYSFHAKNKEDVVALSKDLPQSLQYVYSGYVRILSPDETVQKVAALDIQQLEKEIAENKKETQESAMLKRKEAAKLTEFEQKVLAFVDLAAYLRDDRKALITKCDVMLYNLVSDLYKLWVIPQELVAVSLVADVLKGRENIKTILPVLQQRLSKTSLFMTNGDIYEEDIEEPLDAVEGAYQRQHAPTDAAILKGEPASSGFRRGKVRVIIKTKDFDTFQEGEILVAAMTRPEFVPLMKKAAAIITDEGGITSHAAIVSRELKKPCVIGTRVATQYLKDGDIVEVDATLGVIRVIEKI